MEEAKLNKLKSEIRDVPDFPKKGILFRDLTTMFKDGIVLTIDWYMSEEGRKWTEECTSGEYLKWIEKNYKERT